MDLLVEQEASWLRPTAWWLLPEVLGLLPDAPGPLLEASRLLQCFRTALPETLWLLPEASGLLPIASWLLPIASWLLPIASWLLLKFPIKLVWSVSDYQHFRHYIGSKAVYTTFLTLIFTAQTFRRFLLLCLPTLCLKLTNRHYRNSDFFSLNYYIT